MCITSGPLGKYVVQRKPENGEEHFAGTSFDVACLKIVYPIHWTPTPRSRTASTHEYHYQILSFIRQRAAAVLYTSSAADYQYTG